MRKLPMMVLLVLISSLVALTLSLMLNVYFHLRIASLNAIAEVMVMDDPAEISAYFSGNTVDHMSDVDFAVANDPGAASIEMDKCDVFAYQLPGIPVRVLMVYVSKDGGELIRVAWVGL